MSLPSGAGIVEMVKGDQRKLLRRARSAPILTNSLLLGSLTSGGSLRYHSPPEKCLILMDVFLMVLPNISQQQRRNRKILRQEIAKVI